MRRHNFPLQMWGVRAVFHYDNGDKGYWPNTEGKVYESRAKLAKFIQGRIKRCKMDRMLWESKVAKGITPFGRRPYKVTFEVWRVDLEWEDVTEEWEDEQTLMALGGEL